MYDNLKSLGITILMKLIVTASARKPTTIF